MKIQFERTGGFAGLRLGCEVDITTLPTHEAQAIQDEVESANFFELPAHLPSRSGADRFTYRIEVESAGKKHTVEFGEEAMPEILRPLVQRLNILARSAR
jgi:hypothetical protein